MAAAMCNRTVYHGLLGWERCPFRFAILANAALASKFQYIEVAQQQPPTTARPTSDADAADVPPPAAAAAASAAASEPPPPPSTTMARLQLPVPASDAASLHLIGAKDWLHAPDSRIHAALFEASTVYTHAEGHELPMRIMHDEALHEALAAFFGRFSPADQAGGIPSVDETPGGFSLAEVERSVTDGHQLDFSDTFRSL